MPKKAYLAPYLSSNDLKQKYRTSTDAVESRRWHLLWKISLGWTVKNSAMAVGYSYSYAKSILNRYNQDGEQGVKNYKIERRRIGAEGRSFKDRLQGDWDPLPIVDRALFVACCGS